jgi:hypothetical protein
MKTLELQEIEYYTKKLDRVHNEDSEIVAFRILGLLPFVTGTDGKYGFLWVNKILDEEETAVLRHCLNTPKQKGKYLEERYHPNGTTVYSYVPGSFSLVVKLSNAQQRVVEYLSGFTNFSSTTPTTKTCLNNLSELGVVNVMYIEKDTWVGLTAYGRYVAKEMAGEK